MVHEKEVLILNQLGLHARAAARFVKIANRFQSEIMVQKDNYTVNGKSILGVLTLAASQNTKVKIICKGPDAAHALNALEQLVNDKFEEE